jgi:hypothetical protein
MATLPKFLSASGQVVTGRNYLHGAVVHAGTSVKLYDGTSAAGTLIATFTTLGEAQVLPCVECAGGIYAELAGTTPTATVFYS